MKNRGKQCIKVTYNRQCTPKVCGLLNCEHIENVDGMTGDAVERLLKALEEARPILSVNGIQNLSSKQTITKEIEE